MSSSIQVGNTYEGVIANVTIGYVYVKLPPGDIGVLDKCDIERTYPQEGDLIKVKIENISYTGRIMLSKTNKVDDKEKVDSSDVVNFDHEENKTEVRKSYETETSAFPQSKRNIAIILFVTLIFIASLIISHSQDLTSTVNKVSNPPENIEQQQKIVIKTIKAFHQALWVGDEEKAVRYVCTDSPLNVSDNKQTGPVGWQDVSDIAQDGPTRWYLFPLVEEHNSVDGTFIDAEVKWENPSWSTTLIKLYRMQWEDDSYKILNIW